MPLEKDIDNILDPVLSTFKGKLTTDLEGQAVTTYLSGSAEMIDWGKTQKGIPITFEGPPMQQAIDYAKTRGAQVVTQIDDETKRRLADTISRGIKNKRGVPGLARDIRQQFEHMSKYRSQLIARTETAEALSNASLDRMKDMGVTGKEWVTIGDADVSIDCQGNEAEGVIPADQAFSGGTMAPPQHPNCRCALAPARLKGQPLISDPSKLEKPLLTPTGKSVKDAGITKEWAQKKVKYSTDNKTGQTVIDQIVNEVPVKDLKTCEQVLVLDREAYVPGLVRQYKGQYVGGTFNKGTRIIEISVKQTSNAVTHEFGHAVMNTLPRGSIAKIEKAFAVSKSKGVGFVSEYAKTNVDEYFAEAYRLYQTAPSVLKVKNEPIYNLLFKRYNP